MSDKRTTGSNEVSSSSTLHASTQAFPQRLPRGNDEALHRFWRTFFGHDYNPEDTWDLVRTFAIGLAVGLVVSLIARGTTGIVSISAYTLMGIPVGFMMTLVFLERMFGARS